MPLRFNDAKDRAKRLLELPIPRVIAFYSGEYLREEHKSALIEVAKGYKGKAIIQYFRVDPDNEEAIDQFKDYGLSAAAIKENGIGISTISDTRPPPFLSKQDLTAADLRIFFSTHVSDEFHDEL